MQLRNHNLKLTFFSQNICRAITDDLRQHYSFQIDPVESGLASFKVMFNPPVEGVLFL